MAEFPPMHIKITWRRVSKRNDLIAGWPSIKIFIADHKNSAFVLSDKNVRASRKVGFVLCRMWFWGIIFMLLLFCAFVAVLFFVLSPETPIVVERNGWDADQPENGLIPMGLQKNRIIVTQTGDATESCATRVKNSFLITF